MYLVRHTGLDVLRVAKVISKVSVDKGHILKEAYLIKNLKHPHIPIIYDTYEDDISICIIEEYISGKSLSEYIYGLNGLDISQICDIGIKLCNILEYLHNYQDGIIHLDIKPDNIIIDEYNNVKLIDFGNALYNGEQPDVSMLSPWYAAPEQYLDRKLTVSADIYSVGMILMFMADAKSQKSNVDKHIVCGNKGDLSAIRHDRLYPIIRKCTRHKPEQRYNNILAVHEELERVLGQSSAEHNIQSYSDNHSYVINISGVKRGAGVTHIVLSMAYAMSQYGLKCLIIETSGRSDIQEVMFNGSCEGSGLFSYKGVWYAATDKVAYTYSSDGYTSDMHDYDIIIVDNGTDCIDTSERYDDYYSDKVNYNDIICNYIGSDYKIIDVMVTGVKYGIGNECSIINSIRQNTVLMVNLIDEVQFYEYANYIAGDRKCYRMPCIYSWYGRDENMKMEIKEFMQDNMPEMWENIITSSKSERCRLLYEKTRCILEEICEKFREFIRGEKGTGG